MQEHRFRQSVPPVLKIPYGCRLWSYSLYSGPSNRNTQFPLLQYRKGQKIRQEVPDYKRRGRLQLQSGHPPRGRRREAESVPDPESVKYWCNTSHIES